MSAGTSEVMQIEKGGFSFLVYPKNHEPFWSLVQAGTWEPETFAIFTRFLDREHSYIDIGAWIGPTLLFGSHIARRAYAIEPDPVAYAELSANVSLNKPLDAKIALFPIAITATTGRILFGSRGDGGDSMSSLLFAGRQTTWNVDGIRLHEFVEQHGIEDCNFLKMDIEGGEYAVIPSCAGFLRGRFKPTIFLSLHPLFLGPQSGPLAGVRRVWARFVKTAAVVASLRHYRRIYDEGGRRISGLDVILRSLRYTNFAGVWTDEEWHWQA